MVTFVWAVLLFCLFCSGLGLALAVMRAGDDDLGDGE